ncbi:MAG: hypothetical protein E4G89_07430 [Methanothrix sp.]|nr:MAG: hypothetical protein E4G89_07430 [Methanothrix sp.]
MDNKRLYRLEVTPEAYSIIEAEAFLRGLTLKSIASEILTKHSSKEALSLAASKLEGGKIKEPEEHRDEKPKDQMIIEPKCGPIPGADFPQPTKPKRLSTNPDALRQIKEMYAQSPRPSLAKMSEQIGYHKATIHDAIQRMKKEGEIVD